MQKSKCKIFDFCIFNFFMLGIFDSGFGGLTILKSIREEMPEYDYIYLGDSARYPYGNRSNETLYKFSEEAVNYLFSRGCKLIIIACGTATSAALRKLQQEYLPRKYPDRKILGIVRPLVEKAAVVSRNGKIGITATKNSIKSNAYAVELKKAWENLGKEGTLQIFQNPAPLLVPLIEEGWIDKPETKMILKKYLRPLKEKQIDTLILGCTHYPLLLNHFKRIMGKRCEILDSGKIISHSLNDYLNRHSEIKQKLSKTGILKLLTTDQPGDFNRWGSKYLGESIRAEKIFL